MCVRFKQRNSTKKTTYINRKSKVIKVGLSLKIKEKIFLTGDEKCLRE